MPPDQYQKQLEYQLKKLTLGVSVGLVKGIEPKEASFFNPYQHFVPSLSNGTDLNSQRFKICEKEPPSMEKVQRLKMPFLNIKFLLLSKCYNYSQRFKLTTELGEGTKL